MPELIRPTLVDREIYLRFVNKCRTENKTIQEVLEKFIKRYAEIGQTFFED